MADDKITETPDGRIYLSRPRDDGEKALAFKAHGDAADVLRDAGYVVRVVVERLDGGVLSDDDRAFVSAAMTADPQGSDPREAAASVHFARARVRLAAQKAPSAKKTG